MKYIDAEKLSKNEVWRDCVCNPRYEVRYLSAIAKPEWSYGNYIYVSERLFFGKVRLVRYRNACLPETWMAIGQTVKHLESVNK